MVFSLYIILHGWTDFCVFSCVLFCSFLIIVFLCLCFYAFVLCMLCFIGNIITIISYHGRPALWITPFWQPAYALHLYSHDIVYFLMANKLCCLCGKHLRCHEIILSSKLPKCWLVQQCCHLFYWKWYIWCL